MIPYEEFLKKKIVSANQYGFDIEESDVHPVLKPHQKASVVWAVRGGRRALFEAFGLGKSLMQLEIVRITRERTGGMGLIVCPLGVRQEFVRDARMIGVTPKFIRRIEEATDPEGIYLTNYETIRDGKLNPNHFSVASLDEASCFPGDTMVETPKGLVTINSLNLGDQIYNASGVDYVRDIFKNEVHKAIKIKTKQGPIISSPDHPYFTTRGWMAASELQPGDSIVETQEAMRILRKGNNTKDFPGSQEAFLQSILFSEMAECTTGNCFQDDRNEAKEPGEPYKSRCKMATTENMRVVRENIFPKIQFGTQEKILRECMFREVANEPTASKSHNSISVSHSRGSGQENQKHKGMVDLWSGVGGECEKKDRDAQSNVRPCLQGESSGNSEENRPSSTVDRREGSWNDRTSRDPFSLSRRGVETRIPNTCITEADRFPDMFLYRPGKPDPEDCNRGGWWNAQNVSMEGKGCQEDTISGITRVESVEILEPGHPELEKHRDANGRIYFYDITATRHPSFSVVGLLVHNCLRGFGGTKTFREFMATFAGDRKTLNERTMSTGVNYRFVATATPSPNAYIELLAYAAYLGIMDVSAAKTRFFKRDSTKADNLTIHPHKIEEFWLWVSTWALFVQKPSDLGYDDTGYDMPEMVVNWHKVASDHTQAGTEKGGQMRMFCNAARGVVDSSREKRNSLQKRIEKTLEIVLQCRKLSGREVRYVRQEDIQSGILREEQRKGERAFLEEISRNQGHDKSREKKGVHEGIPQDIQAEKTNPRRTRRAESEETGAICERFGTSGKIEGSSTREQQKAPSHETQWTINIGVRDNLTGIQRYPEGSGWWLRNLRSSTNWSERGQEGRTVSIGGSRPYHRGGKGDSLPSVQFRSRSLSGRPCSSHESSGLSDQIVIWCDLNDEQKAIERALLNIGVSFSSLYGNQNIDERDCLLEKWKNKETSVLLTKPTMYGAGVNLQQSHTMIFSGIGFKFNDIFQGIHRIHRFLQKHSCDIHFIYTEAENGIRKQLERKWNQHNEMVGKMTEIIKKYGLSMAGMVEHLSRKMGVERIESTGERYRIVNNDCILETRSMQENSVGLILTSIPFSTQYEYSPNYADLGHTDNNAHFWQQMDYLIPELYRVLQPGRIAAIHVKDRIVPGGMTGLGFQTVYPFHMDCTREFCKHGFGYMGMKTIVTDVVRENNQTYRLGWTEQCKDGTKMGVGMPEYLMLFRKPPTDTVNSYADVPVVKTKEKYSRSRWQIDAHGFTRSSGDRLLDPEELKQMDHAEIFQLFRQYSLTEVYNFEHHVKIGEMMDLHGRLPVTFMLLQPQSWAPDVYTDITRMLTLNGAQSAKGKEMHLCPMQLDLADRVIEQFSMENEVVYDPFAGLGTVPMRAVMKHRYGLGCELSPRYFTDAASYCKMAEIEMNQPTLFSLIEIEKCRNNAEQEAV